MSRFYTDLCKLQAISILYHQYRSQILSITTLNSSRNSYTLPRNHWMLSLVDLWPVASLTIPAASSLVAWHLTKSCLCCFVKWSLTFWERRSKELQAIYKRRSRQQFNWLFITWVEYVDQLSRGVMTIVLLDALSFSGRNKCCIKSSARLWTLIADNNWAY